MSKQAPATQKAKPDQSSAGTGAASATVVQVTNIEELYKEVNRWPDNVGATIELQPGNYLLSPRVDPNDPNTARPNGGRLDLLEDMSLCGVIGDASAVTIDTGLLESSALVYQPEPSFRMGAIRVGFGNNAIEWLTVRGNSKASASIATDHLATMPTTIRVAHVVLTDPSVIDPTDPKTSAVDIRNLGQETAGRRIDAVIEDCDFSGGHMGIRFANFEGANGGEVYGVMKNNLSHDNRIGCFLGHNRTTSAIVNVSSTDDKFVNNRNGCVIIGGIVISQTASVPDSNGNYTTFEAYKSEFTNNNNSTIKGKELGGIYAIGGEAPNNPRTTSYNFVRVRLEDCLVGNSPAPDFTAFGARNVLADGSPGTDIAGTYNTVAIELVGSNQSLTVNQTISVPPEPTKPTNKITINARKKKGDVQPPDPIP